MSGGVFFAVGVIRSNLAGLGLTAGQRPRVVTLNDRHAFPPAEARNKEGTCVSVS